jgi:transcriptional repressor NrdR
MWQDSGPLTQDLGVPDVRCPFCGSEETRVIDTTPEAERRAVRRRRECPRCLRRFTTIERPIHLAPLVIKRDGRREPFDREKLLRGIQIACAKRPIPAEALERLVERIEARIQAMGKPEIPSRQIGDMVIAGLKELDEIAYIRYAIVYLGLSDLESIRREIDSLLEARAREGAPSPVGPA